MDKNTAELLQEMIDIKKNTRSAIENKGVSIVGGMKTYPASIGEISQVFAGTEIDFTRAGWLQTDSNYQNQKETNFINDALNYSNLLWRLYGDYKNWTREWIDDQWYRIPPDFSNAVIAPNIINYEIDYPCYMGLSFNRHYNLRYVPPFNTSKITNFSHFFGHCRSLVNVPLINTSNGTNFFNMVWFCTSIYEFPQLDMSNAEDVRQMFYECDNLRSIPKLNFSKVKDTSYMLHHCSKLEYLGGFEGLKASLELKHILSVNNEHSLTIESVMNVIDNLYDWVTNPDGVNKQDYSVSLSAGQLNLPYDLGEQLTEDQILVATNKGWTISW